MSPLATVLAQANRAPPAPPQTNVATTPVASIYAANDAQKMDQYKAELAQQNAQFGGLASLGSAGISVLPKLLGGAGAAAGAIPGAIGATSLGGAPLVAGAGSILPFLAAI